MHNLLKRQLKKIFGNDFSPDEKFSDFLALINEAYSNFDSDRKLLERSLELSSKEMQEALDQANEAARIKSMFLAHMSHEIRTPLNGVIGMLQLMQDTSLDKEQDDYVKVANSSAVSLLTVINDILDFSKIESGKFKIDQIDFNFADWFNKTIEIMNIHAHRKEQELVAHIETEIPQIVTSDPNRLRQILINLISNAIKFTDKKGGILVLAKHKIDGDEIFLDFSVSDSGIGISPNNAKKIFSPFEQGDASINRKYGGTGLGLTISKNIVEQMNGNISFSSTENVGTVFNFNVKAQSKNLDKQWYNIESNFTKKLINLKTLIVTDNSAKHNRYETLLNKWQMKVKRCNSIKEAKEIVKKEEFELIIFDFKNRKDKINELKTDIQELRKISPILLITPRYLTNLNLAIEELDCERTCSSTTLGNLFDIILRTIVNKNKPKTITKKIILAEDNEVNQKLASIMLEKSGYQVYKANNGEEALSILEKENDISLILMDLQMPIMDGLTTTSSIRNCNEKYRKIPIIAMTAHANQSDKDLCLKEGMNDFLSKPFQKQELLILLEKYINS